MDREAARVCERLEEFVEELVADPARRRFGKCASPGEVRTPRKVDHHPRESLVKGNGGLAETPDAGLVPMGGLDGLADGKPRVLQRVVRVNLQVPPGGKHGRDAAVAECRVKHVVEEGDACPKGVPRGGAVQVDSEIDGGLLCLAMDFGGAWHSSAWWAVDAASVNC